MGSNKLDRRGFLKGLAAAGGLAAWGGAGPLAQLARAQTASDKHYVFAYFSGGWDILLGLDPRDPVVFNNGNVSATRIQPGYELLTATNVDLVDAGGGMILGPFVGELAALRDRLIVVRGMSMDTLTHEVGRRRFLTGKPPSGLLARGSSASSWLASRLGADQPIPNLSVQVESYNVDQPTYATALKVSSVDDLLRTLQPGQPAMDPRAVLHLDALLEAEATCATARNSPLWQKAQQARSKARQMVQGNLDQLFTFLANTPQMAALRAHYGITGTNLRTPEAQAAMAAAALTGGVSRVVSIQVANGLDTHFDDWTRDQGPRQMQGFNAISRLATDLASREYKGTGTSWLDHTVIVGFSEFSRTAMLNDRSGRDHALTNACLVLGGSLKGGQVVGASSDVALIPQPINLQTGRVDLDAGSIIRPEHVLRTLYEDAGITGDPADLRAEPIRAMLMA